MAGDGIAPRRRAPTLVERLSATFVAPAGDDVAAAAIAVAVPQVAVLAAPPDVWVVGAAAALGRGGIAVVAGWGARPPVVRAAATPAARRLATALVARGHKATASGRLVRVVLAGSGGEVAAEVARIAAAADPAPCVAALAGARDERIDALLRGQDRVVIHGADDVADLALESIAPLAPARRLEIGTVPAAARALAAAGVALVPPLRAAVEDALR